MKTFGFPNDPELVAAVEDACATLKVHFLFPLTDLKIRLSDGESQVIRRKNGPDWKTRAGLRALLAERDGNLCFYCREPFAGSKERTLDHLVPLAMLSTWDPQALVLACDPCNSAKSDRIPSVLVPLFAALVYRLAKLNAAPVERSLVLAGGAR